MAITSAFQADDVGSIPTRRLLFKNVLLNKEYYKKLNYLRLWYNGYYLSLPS
jgi:hypothetical protein